MSLVLSSWKEIASFFGKGVRTVQRWERSLGLPIHRPDGAPQNIVFARTDDLQRWILARHTGQDQREAASPKVDRMHALLADLHKNTLRLQSASRISADLCAQLTQTRNRSQALREVRSGRRG